MLLHHQIDSRQQVGDGAIRLSLPSIDERPASPRAKIAGVSRDVTGVDRFERAIVAGSQGDLERRGGVPETDRLVLGSRGEDISKRREGQGNES